jgi:hypothetical protein
VCVVGLNVTGLLVQYCVRECVCVCVCVSGVWTVHCVGYGEIVWYMQLNVFVCHSKSVSVCVCSWLEIVRVTCTVLCESVCELV